MSAGRNSEPEPPNPGGSRLVAVLRLRRPERRPGLSCLALNFPGEKPKNDRNSHPPDPYLSFLSLFSHFCVFFSRRFSMPATKRSRRDGPTYSPARECRVGFNL